MNKKYTYKDFISDLTNRREFDIVVYGDKYGISWFGGGNISFAKYGDLSFSRYFDTVNNFDENARINDKLLSVIWDDIEVDVIY